MNFYFNFFFLFFVNLYTTSFFSQIIENIDFSSHGRNIIITFDLANCSPTEKYDISLVFVEQNTNQRIIPKSIRGDFKNQSCGNKKITWFINEDLTSLIGSYYPEINIKIAIINPLNIEFVDIPSGYLNISTKNDNTKQIFINSLKMSKYEITFEQYDAFCDSTGRQKPPDRGWGRGQRPVINVSWNNANEFAKWIGGRLPTEYEWDYACRAGSNTLYHTGNKLTEEDANFNDAIKKTTIVGSYSPNAFGLYDMYGNVWEWCKEIKALGGCFWSSKKENDPYDYDNVLKTYDILDNTFFNNGLGFRVVL